MQRFIRAQKEQRNFATGAERAAREEGKQDKRRQNDDENGDRAEYNLRSEKRTESSSSHEFCDDKIHSIRKTSRERAKGGIKEDGLLRYRRRRPLDPIDGRDISCDRLRSFGDTRSTFV